VQIADAGQNFAAAEVTDEKSTTPEGDVKYSLREYAAQVDEVKNNKHDPNNHIYMGTTMPTLVDILGLPKLPMLITPNHIYSISVTENQAKTDKRFRKGVNYHGLGWNTTKHLPILIGNPQMIIKSNTDQSDATVVIVTGQNDNAGDPIIAAIKPDGKGNYLNLEFPSVTVLSGYGKHNLQNYIAKAKTENRILYVYNKNSQKKQNTTGVHFSDNIRFSDYSSNLSQFRKIVKQKYSGTVFENSGLQQFSLRNEEVDTSPRGVLANALEAVVQNPAERELLEKYRGKLAQMEEQEQRLREVNAQIRELSFAKGPRDKAQLQALREEAAKARNRLNTYDKQLLRRGFSEA